MKVQVPKLNGIGSLITYEKDGMSYALGHLADFGSEHGVQEPNLGRVDVSKENADIHNKLLDESLLKGLEETCEVGQGGVFYYNKGPNGSEKVTTWTGIVVASGSRSVRTVGRVITFVRAGKKFRGCLRKHGDLFNFRRIK